MDMSDFVERDHRVFELFRKRWALGAAGTPGDFDACYCSSSMRFTRSPTVSISSSQSASHTPQRFSRLDAFGYVFLRSAQLATGK